MSKTLTENPEINEPVEEEGKEKVYHSVADYLSAYEDSEQFQEVLNEREKALKAERPGLQISREDLVAGTRQSSLYRENLFIFFKAGNWLPKDLTSLNEPAQKAIKDYWHYFEEIMPNHDYVIRATAHSDDDAELKLFQLEKERERFHTFAGLAILGEGVTLKNGDKLTCVEFSPDDENALSLLQYNALGRTLVSFISEENGKDIADPTREARKMEITRQFWKSNSSRGIGFPRENE